MKCKICKNHMCNILLDFYYDCDIDFVKNEQQEAEVVTVLHMLGFM